MRVRVYKEGRIDTKTSRKIKSTNWYIDFYDHYRRRHNLAAFADKRETVGLAKKIESLVACQISGQQPGPEMQQWIDRLPNRFKNRFNKWGLLEGSRVAATQRLSDHLKDWLNSQVAKGVNEKSHALQQYSRVIRVFSACGFTYWQDLQASKLLQTVNGFTKLQQKSPHPVVDTGKPLSPRSKSHYLDACKQFANWMAMDGRISTNPINHLKMTCLIETQNPRRPLSLDEIHVLMAHIINSKPLRFMPGYERLLLYQFAIETGLRANEIRTLTRKGFDFEQLNMTALITIESFSWFFGVSFS
jgi:integrase